MGLVCLWQASFGVMNSVTSKGLNALAQALCQYAELTMTLFKQKALYLFENNILAHGQRSVYTLAVSVFLLWYSFHKKAFKQVLKRLLNASSLSIPRNK